MDLDKASHKHLAKLYPETILSRFQRKRQFNLRILPFYP